MPAYLEEVECTFCREDTGYRTDHRMLYDEAGAVANDSKNGLFLVQGFICPRCGKNNFWMMKTPMEIENLRRKRK